MIDSWAEVMIELIAISDRQATICVITAGIVLPQTRAEL